MYTSATCGNQGFPWLLEMKGSGAQTAEIHNLGPATITHQDGGAHHPSMKRPIKEMISQLKSHFQSHLQHTRVQHEMDVFTWIPLLCQKPGIQ